MLTEQQKTIVSMATTVCNGGIEPVEAIQRVCWLLEQADPAREITQTEREAALQELQQRFSGRNPKPWEVQP